MYDVYTYYTIMRARERQVARGFHFVFLLIYSGSDLYDGRERKRIIFSCSCVLYLLSDKIENRNKSITPQGVIRQFRDRNRTKKTSFKTENVQTFKTETKSLQIRNIDTQHLTRNWATINFPTLWQNYKITWNCV